MREHMGLYRGKRIDNGEWVKGSLLKVTLNGETAYLIFEDNFSVVGNDVKALSHALVDPNTVGECTGMRDENGELIFEGDVIKSLQGKILAVKFGQYRDDEEVVSGNGWYVSGEYGTLSFDERWAGHKIIGTVHDNPELLKGGEGDG